MPIIISKDAISECRDHLLAELIVTGDVVVNSYKYTVQDLLDMMVAEDKDSVFALVLKDCSEAKAQADRLIALAFDCEVCEEVIEAHLTDGAEDLALERRLEEEYEYDH